MKFGFIGSFGTATQNVALARECEEHGWDGFFTWDAVSMGGFGGGGMAVYDPFAVLAAAAAVTERITLGAMVFAAPRHRPWELAQRALTVDHLSGGRLVLPVGVGVLDDLAFGSVPGQVTGLKDRAEQLDEVLAWLERSWSGETFEFEGDHVRTGPFRFPEPPVRGRIPVWPVGVWDAERPPVKNLRRALRWDGIVPQLRGTADEPPAAKIADLVAWIDEQRAAAGQTGPFDVVAQGKLSADPVEAADQAKAMAAAGATWWIDSWWDPEKDTPESLLAKVRQGPPAL
jgi:hypothetical protein